MAVFGPCQLRPASPITTLSPHRHAPRTPHPTRYSPIRPSPSPPRSPPLTPLAPISLRLTSTSRRPNHPRPLARLPHSGLGPTGSPLPPQSLPVPSADHAATSSPRPPLARPPSPPTPTPPPPLLPFSPAPPPLSPRERHLHLHSFPPPRRPGPHSLLPPPIQQQLRYPLSLPHSLSSPYPPRMSPLPAQPLATSVAPPVSRHPRRPPPPLPLFTIHTSPSSLRRRSSAALPLTPASPPPSSSLHASARPRPPPASPSRLATLASPLVPPTLPL
ncbi:uncharacterized protein [Salvelinus sp. IW2-2015]|uniref:uncharacterized protein n=1 Tax=Salvelinus sp. IW2-2015 TaxID=2691554 RepID=UPI0038D452BC